MKGGVVRAVLKLTWLLFVRYRLAAALRQASWKNDMCTLCYTVLFLAKSSGKVGRGNSDHVTSYCVAEGKRNAFMQLFDIKLALLHDDQKLLDISYPFLRNVGSYQQC